MEHLARAFHPMPLSELVSAAEHDAIPDRAVAVTFDDGTLDSLVASDILGECGVPATFFLNSERANEPHETWISRLERILLVLPEVPPRLAFSIGPVQLALRCDGWTARRGAFDALYCLGVGLLGPERDTLADYVESWVGVPLRPRLTHRLLTVSEMRELASRPGVAIGGHSTHHLHLTMQSAAVVEQEIGENRRFLRDVVQQPVEFFAYPYGAHSPEVKEAARAAGYLGAVTVEEGLVRAPTAPHLLPRFEMKDVSLERFGDRLDEIFARTSGTPA
jgi:peptidoglycan/xylan/chitin deacetylase (PgdA/CDA1 family)